MKKQLLIVLVLFLSFYTPAFASGCNCGTNSFATSNNQKACKNVVSFIFIDFSFLSPKATAADLNIGGMRKLKKHCWFHKCSTPQCCADECCEDECCNPQCCPPKTCPQTCVPKDCPCAPQCPNCRTQSMIPDENKQETVGQNIEQEGIIPVSYKQETGQKTTKQKSKANMFRIDLFRCFKFEIL